MRAVVGGILVGSLVAGCASSDWNGVTRRWGSLREVLRDGQVSGRVRVLEAGIGPGSVGVGALADLAGEITVVNGEVWVARPAADGRIVARSGAEPSTQAAFLALAEVPAWAELPVKQDLGLGELEDILAALLSQFPSGKVDSLPFVVEGPLGAVQAHVLNGKCPFAAVEERRGEPVRFERSAAQGVLVGFFSTLPPGILAHHGSRLHTHVLLRDQDPAMGHLDDVRVLKGGVIKVPALAMKD